MSISPLPTTTGFHKRLLHWYAKEGRQLPWRQTRDPYAIVVSEVMLQQTQVSRGLPKFIAWMKEFPTVQDLASAPLSAVLKAWQGLGYNRRGKYVWMMAKQIMEQHGGVFPHTKEEILALPGVGPHTAGAIMSFAFGVREPIFDTNAIRVVGRVFKGFQALPLPNATAIEKLMQTTTPPAKKIFDFNQALMDLGALVCTAKKPQCEICPLKLICKSYPAILSAAPAQLRMTKAANENRYFGQPRRIWRGKILRVLHEQAPRSFTFVQLGRKIQTDFDATRLPWLRSVVQLLANEGMVRVEKNQITLP